MKDDKLHRPSDDAIGRLIRSAGQRPTASDAAKARVYASVKATWQRSIADRHRDRASHRRRRPTSLFWMTAAACGAVAVFFVAIPFPGSSPLAVGMLSKMQGPVLLSGAGSAPQPLPDDFDGTLFPHDVLQTGPGGKLAIRLTSQESLRINERTEVVLESQNTLLVRRGTVYVDTGQPGRASLEGLRVSTPLGSVWHTGTQYEVNVGAEELRIRVREGAVVFSDTSRELATESGEQILIPANGQPVRSVISSHDAAWEWAADLATVQGAGPHRVASLLVWIARETGRELRFASPGVEAQIQLLTLHGVEGLTPLEALGVIRSTTAFEYRFEDSVLLVSSTGV